MGLFSRKKRIAGLDIGEHSIKFAEVKKNGHGIELVNFALLPTPREAMMGGTLPEHFALASSLKQIIEICDGKAPKVAMSLSANSVLIRHFTLPDMPENEMAEAVKFEVEANLPIPISEMTVDFIKVGEATDGDVRKYEIMIVAAKNAIIQKVVESVSISGIEPVRLDIEPLALLRTVQLDENLDLDGSFAIVNIGSSNTNISIFENSVLRFTRGVAVGGNKISSNLSNYLGISIEEAEQIKRDISLSFPVETEDTGFIADNKVESIHPVIDELFMEISRTMEFYQAKYRGQKVNKIYFCGGTASLNGLAKLASSQLYIESEILNPFKNISISSKLSAHKTKIEEAGSAMAVAVGLALSEVN